MCEELSGHRWIPLTKASGAELWCFLWPASWINSWVNNSEAGDLRRHRAHHDIIVMAVSTGISQEINLVFEKKVNRKIFQTRWLYLPYRHLAIDNDQTIFTLPIYICSSQKQVCRNNLTVVFSCDNEHDLIDSVESPIMYFQQHGLYVTEGVRWDWYRLLLPKLVLFWVNFNLFQAEMDSCGVSIRWPFFPSHKIWLGFRYDLFWCLYLMNYAWLHLIHQYKCKKK